MADGSDGAVLRQVNRLFGPGTVAGLTEGELLDRFVARRDEAAFEALVARHGPMVLGVCRRALRDPHDAEDAFQATFLVLARRAGAIRDRERLARWLFGVALRISARARVLAGRRRDRERPAPSELAGPEFDPAGWELRAILDEEIGRLPGRYRSPVVLCYLEGRSHTEAARQLGWPVGTVKGRLSRARDLLRSRLLRRGLSVPAAALAMATACDASAAVPEALIQSTTRIAPAFAAGGATAGMLPAASAALARGTLRTMTMMKLKVLSAAVLAVGLAAGGAGVIAQVGKAGDDGPVVPVSSVSVKDAPAGRDDRTAIQGRWQVLSVEVGGKLENITSTGHGPTLITRDRIIPARQPPTDSPPTEVRYTLDPSRDPGTIDLENPKGPDISDPDLGGPILGIYRLEGNHLTLCLGAPGKPRPTAFATDPGSQSRLMNLRRLGPASDEARADESRDDLAKIQGRWFYVRRERKGETLPFSSVHRPAIFTSDTFIQTIGVDGAAPKELPAFRFKLDAGREPKKIDLIYNLAHRKGEVLPGIYRLDGGTLTICFSEPGKPRPKAFDTIYQPDVTLDTLQRRTPSPDGATPVPPAVVASAAASPPSPVPDANPGVAPPGPTRAADTRSPRESQPADAPLISVRELGIRLKHAQRSLQQKQELANANAISRKALLDAGDVVEDLQAQISASHQAMLDELEILQVRLAAKEAELQKAESEDRLSHAEVASSAKLEEIHAISHAEAARAERKAEITKAERDVRSKEVQEAAIRVNHAKRRLAEFAQLLAPKDPTDEPPPASPARPHAPDAVPASPTPAAVTPAPSAVPKADAEGKERAIREKLERTIDLTLEQARLEEAIKAIKAATGGPEDGGIPIYVEPADLQAVDKTINSRVNLAVRGATVATALRLLLGQLGLTYKVQDGLVKIVGKPGAGGQTQYERR